MFLYFSSTGERIIEFDVKLCSSGPFREDRIGRTVCGLGLRYRAMRKLWRG